MPYLNNPSKVSGTWKNGRLTLWVDSEFTRSMLNKPAVLEPPAEPAQAAPAAEKDPLDDLLSFGGQFDNITIQ